MNKNIIKLYENMGKEHKPTPKKSGTFSKYDLKNYMDIIYEDSCGLKPVDNTINYDAEQLKMGIKVEQEHTSNVELAERIAKHHLAEDPEYYSKLKKVEEYP